MTKPSVLTSKLLREKYVTFDKSKCGRWRFFIEPDLLHSFAEGTVFVPMTDGKLDRHGNHIDHNVGIWVKCHGGVFGSLYFDGREVDPKMIRDEVTKYWSREVPIMLSCCHPAAVKERWGKELKKYNITLFDEYYEEAVYASDPNWGGYQVGIWTEAEQQRMVMDARRCIDTIDETLKHVKGE